MKALRILLVAAMAMMMVSGAFAQELEIGGEAEYSIEFDNTEVGDADAVTNIALGDGGNVALTGTVSKELDNGATVSLEGVAILEYDSIGNDGFSLTYANGPLTVKMLDADRDGFMSKGLDVYVPQDELYCGELADGRDISFAYAGDTMKFVTTLNWNSGTSEYVLIVDDEEITNEVDVNKIGVHPYVEMTAGPATIKALVEVVNKFPQNTDADGPTVTHFGGGVGVEANLGAIEVGASGGYAVLGGTNYAGDDVDATNQMSMYAYAKMAVGAGTVGVGGGYDMESIDDVDDDYSGYQVNFGYEQGDIVVPGLTFKVGAGYAFNESHSKVETTKTGGSVTLVYGF